LFRISEFGFFELEFAMIANTTCDIYRDGNAPPSAPDVAAVPCFLRPAFPQGNEAAANTGLFYSHILEVDVAADVRDGAAEIGGPGADWVYVPDKDGTQFSVIAVVRTGYGTGVDRRRVFLKRMATTYPTTYL